MHGQPLASQVVRLISRLLGCCLRLSLLVNQTGNVYRTVPRSGILTN